jgi:hypothetical protein
MWGLIGEDKVKEPKRFLWHSDRIHKDDWFAEFGMKSKEEVEENMRSYYEGDEDDPERIDPTKHWDRKRFRWNPFDVGIRKIPNVIVLDVFCGRNHVLFHTNHGIFAWGYNEYVFITLLSLLISSSVSHLFTLPS